MKKAVKKTARPPASTAWLEKFKEDVASFTERGNYKGAMPLVKSALREYPNEFEVKFNYAKILGDWADELPPKQKAKMKAQAVTILKPLLRSMAGKPALSRFSVSLNYYYQSESWKQMYAFGKRFARFNKQKSLYAQGLAATHASYDFLMDKKLASSRAWAARAIQAWKKYDFKNETYYFAPYNYAKALALAGEFVGAVQYLKLAAKLSQRPVTDWEFADVVKLIPGGRV